MMRVQIEKEAFLIIEDGKKPIRVDVEFKPRAGIGLKSDLLARAIGYKSGAKLNVLDATAGLCRDAFHMAALGCQVVALEENEKIFQVVSAVVSHLPDKYKLSIQHIEAKKFMRDLPPGGQPDVIYLDPMFPEKKKSAKSGKETVLLQLLAEKKNPVDETELFELALKASKKRVVVKRPLSAPVWSKPKAQFVGKAVRYDVYVVA